MNGYIYYSKFDAERNKSFIEELISEAAAKNIELKLLLKGEIPSKSADFIIFRDRDSVQASTWESTGFRLFNRAEVNRIANNKLTTFQLSSVLGVPAVPTRKFKNASDITTFPSVLKTVDGHGGNEVVLCSSKEVARHFTAKHHEHELIVQPFIETGAQDVRVFMMGSEVLGAVKRTGNGSFKSNYTLGGSAEKYKLTEWQEKVACKIAKALKSDYIGIDFLLLHDGSWLLNEIEDPVGARSFYATHELSIAKKLIEHIHRKLNSI